MQQTTSERKVTTAPLGADQLQQALNHALNAGAAGIAQQIRYVLAYSQMHNARPVLEPYREKPLTVAQARLAALIAVAHTLSPRQLQNLIGEIEQVKDNTARLTLTIQLLPHLSAERVAAVWRITTDIPNPVLKARAMLALVAALPTLEDEQTTASALPEILALAQSISSTEARIRSLITLAAHTSHAHALFQHILEDIAHSNNDTIRSNTLCAIASVIPDDLKTSVIESALSIQSPVERARALTLLAQTHHEAPELRMLALEAVTAIRSEEERVEALEHFRPNLENASEENGYPEALKEALVIAVNFTRRSIRARALVALAPYLTPDLQGEALAAVHSLSNERDRARLLGELAPNLPPDMLVASLAVAHTMREQDARVHALGILAHYVSSKARNQTILDAFAAASHLPNHYERVRALLALVDVLPQQLQDQAFTNALETTRLIENENARARALSLLGHHLPPHLLSRALESAYQLRDPQQRLSTLASITAHLTDAEQYEEAVRHMLTCAAEMPFEYKQARALISIAPHLKREHMPDALQLTDMMSDPFDKTSAYIALAQNMPPEQRPEMVNRAWQLLQKVEDGYDKASALASLAPLLPEEVKRHLAGFIGMIIGSIMDEYDQASAISLLAPLLVEGEQGRYNSPYHALPDAVTVAREAVFAALDVPYQGMRVALLAETVAAWETLPQEARYTLWRETIQRLKALPLADVLLCLGAVMPIIHQFSGDEGVRRVIAILGIQPD